MFWNLRFAEDPSKMLNSLLSVRLTIVLDFALSVDSLSTYHPIFVNTVFSSFAQHFWTEPAYLITVTVFKIKLLRHLITTCYMVNKRLFTPSPHMMWWRHVYVDGLFAVSKQQIKESRSFILSIRLRVTKMSLSLHQNFKRWW